MLRRGFGAAAAGETAAAVVGSAVPAPWGRDPPQWMLTIPSVTLRAPAKVAAPAIMWESMVGGKWFWVTEPTTKAPKTHQKAVKGVEIRVTVTKSWNGASADLTRGPGLCGSSARSAHSSAVPETEEAAVPETEEAAVPETEEAAVPETEEAAVPETEEAAVPETKEAAVPETKEAAVPETKEAAVPETPRACAAVAASKIPATSSGQNRKVRLTIF